jgi:hypothetical protein
MMPLVKLVKKMQYCWYYWPLVFINAMRINGTCVICLVVGYAIKRCLINDDERKRLRKALQAC